MIELASGDTGSAGARLNEALSVFQAFEMNPELLGCLEDHARSCTLEAAVEFALAGTAGTPVPA